MGSNYPKSSVIETKQKQAVLRFTPFTTAYTLSKPVGWVGYTVDRNYQISHNATYMDRRRFLHSRGVCKIKNSHGSQNTFSLHIRVIPFLFPLFFPFSVKRLPFFSFCFCFQCFPS